MSKLDSNITATLLGTFIGGFISIIIFLFTNHVNKINQDRIDKKNLLINITVNNQSLFSLIYFGSISEDNIDYIKLRQELKKTNILWLLPSPIKEYYKELCIIFSYTGDDFKKRKGRVQKCLINIVTSFSEYGVEVFGIK